MRKIFSAFFLLSAFISSAQTTYQKTIGCSGRDQVYDIHSTWDGGFIMTGWTDSLLTGNFDVLLIKTDSLNDTLWTRTFGGAGADEGLAVAETNDSGYIITGYTKSFGSVWKDLYLLKTDHNGNLLWSKDFGGSANQSSTSIIVTNNNEYLITDNNGLIKTDSSGNIIWAKVYAGNIHSIQESNDGNLIMTGEINAANYTSVYLLKTDTSGTPLWSKEYIDQSYGYATDFKQTTDGGYIITGNSYRSFENLDYAYLIKTDSSGNLSWLKIFTSSGHEHGESVAETSDGGYAFTGYTYNGFSDDLYLVKTDNSGSNLWSKAIGDHNGDDWGYSLLKTNDDGVIAAGFTFGYGAGDDDVYIIKTDSMGNSGCNDIYISSGFFQPATIDSDITTTVSTFSLTEIPASTVAGSGRSTSWLCSIIAGTDDAEQRNIFSVFPNPSTGLFSISFHSEIKNGLIEVFNVFGKNIFETKISGEKLKEIDLKNFSSGVYFIKVFDGEKQNSAVINIDKF